MTDKPGREPQPRPLPEKWTKPEVRRDLTPPEFIIALAMCVGGIALAWHTATLYVAGKPCEATMFAGFTCIVLGGCFDPLNFLWLCLPFTRDQIVFPTRYDAISGILSCVGLVVVLAGWVGKYWLSWP